MLPALASASLKSKPLQDAVQPANKTVGIKKNKLGPLSGRTDTQQFVQTLRWRRLQKTGALGSKSHVL